MIKLSFDQFLLKNMTSACWNDKVIDFKIRLPLRKFRANLTGDTRFFTESDSSGLKVYFYG